MQQQFLLTLAIKKKSETVSYQFTESCKFTTSKKKSEENIILKPYKAKPLFLCTMSCNGCNKRSGYCFGIGTPFISMKVAQWCKKPKAPFPVYEITRMIGTASTSLAPYSKRLREL